MDQLAQSQQVIGEHHKTMAHLVSQRDKAEHDLAICRDILQSIRRSDGKHWWLLGSTFSPTSDVGSMVQQSQATSAGASVVAELLRSVSSMPMCFASPDLTTQAACAEPDVEPSPQHACKIQIGNEQVSQGRNRENCHEGIFANQQHMLVIQGKECQYEHGEDHNVSKIQILDAKDQCGKSNP